MGTPVWSTRLEFRLQAVRFSDLKQPPEGGTPNGDSKRILQRKKIFGDGNVKQVEDSATSPATKVRGRARTGRRAAASYRATDGAEHPAGDESGRGAHSSS